MRNFSNLLLVIISLSQYIGLGGGENYFPNMETYGNQNLEGGGEN